MKKTTLACAMLLTISGAAQDPATEPGAPASRIGFPFETGTQWVYSRTVKRQLPDAGPELKSIHLKAEIVEVVKRAHVSAALMRGCPLGLTVSDTLPGECLVVQVGTNLLYIMEPPRVPEAIRRLRDREDELVGLLHESEIVIDFPLSVGKRIGESAQITRQCRDDSGLNILCSFLWTVTADRELDGTLGPREYQLRWQGQSGYRALRFVNGLGITGFAFDHGPSGAGADVNLVAYQAGQH
jgi:hypothetical protein